MFQIWPVRSDRFAPKLCGWAMGESCRPLKLRFRGASGDWLQAQKSKDSGLPWRGLRLLAEGAARGLG